MFTICPIQPSHHAATTAIRNSAAAEPVSVDVFSEWCELDPVRNTHYYNLVAVDDHHAPLGYVIACINDHLPANCWYISVTVHPDARRQGIGAALYAEAERLAVSHGAATVMSDARSEDDDARPWAEHRGYICTRERTESVMNLDGWDAEPFRGAIAQATATGLRFDTVRDLAEAGLLERYYEFSATTVPDWPGFEPPFPPCDAWKRLYVGPERDRTPKIHVLAMDGEHVAGVCIINLPRSEGQGGMIGFTGVSRAYRGRGLALALKVVATDEAKREGVSHIRTNNDNDNPAILAVNAKLGYKPVPGPLRFKKNLV